jgi:hypothetical protein
MLRVGSRRENGQIARTRNFNIFATRHVHMNNNQILCRSKPMSNLHRLNTLFKDFNETLATQKQSHSPCSHL